MRCVGIPEAIWTGSITDLKKTDTDSWTARFLARKDLAGCTAMSETFHQAKHYLDGDPSDVSKFLFVCSDLLHDTPTTSVRACTGPRGELADDFPWEILLEKLLFMLTLIWSLPYRFSSKLVKTETTFQKGSA